MKNKFRHFLILIVIALTIAFIFSWICDFYTYSYINALFTIGYIYVTIGFFLYADEKGFFNYAKYSLKRVASLVNRKRTLGQKEESLQQIMQKKPLPLKITLPFILSGISIVIATLIISLYV